MGRSDEVGEREQNGREQPLAAEEMSGFGFSLVVNQDYQRVRAFKEEAERNWESHDQLLALCRRTGMPALCIVCPH